MTIRLRGVLALACVLCAAHAPSGRAVSQAAGTGQSSGATYYVDAASGDDGASGRTMAAAWRTLARVNRVDAFEPGDRILFKAGGAWTGQLRPRGSGAKSRPITIDRYGEGGRPRIDAGPDAGDALYLCNQSFWEIGNLELTSQDPAKPNDRTRRGVFVEARGSFVEHIHLKQLIVHDIRGLLALGDNFNLGKDSAGIGFEVTDTANGARFHDLLVEGSDLYAIDSTGIFTKGKGGVYPRSPGWDAIKFTGVVLQDNTIHDIAKNAIIVRQLDGGLIQRNRVWDTAYRARSGNQIFTRTCYATVVQFNEGYLNRAVDDMDGSAFDADLESPATVWQYNYSHDNKFGLITLCTVAQDKDIVIRYNISRNDQGRLVNINYNFAGVHIYNNVFVIPAHLSPQILWETHARTGTNFTGTQRYAFDNNIVYNLSPTATYNLNPNAGSKRQTTRVMRNNVFFGQHPAGEPLGVAPGLYHTLGGHITSDPGFVNPDGGGDGIATLEGYRIRAGSACIRAGLFIPANGGRDFWGTRLPDGPPDIGIHQFAAPSIRRDRP